MIVFEVGDAVVDREAEDPDNMRVLDPRIGKANEVVIPELEKTVHEMNPEYPANDIVTETVYESWLDSNVPDWNDWPKKQINKQLHGFIDEWSVTLQSYYYPRWRLQKIADHPRD